MVDKSYVTSLLGFANLIELILLTGAFIIVCLASTSYDQTSNSYPNIMKQNTNQTTAIDPRVFYDLDAHAIKQIDQIILIIIFSLTLFSFVSHIVFSFRYRYSWHRLSKKIAFLCIVYALVLFSISTVVSCWENEIRKQTSNSDLSNQISRRSNSSANAQVGLAATAATFGFAACLIYLAEALIRFRHLADKTQP